MKEPFYSHRKEEIVPKGGATEQCGRLCRSQGRWGPGQHLCGAGSFSTGHRGPTVAGTELSSGMWEAMIQRGRWAVAENPRQVVDWLTAVFSNIDTSVPPGFMLWE